MSSALQFKHMKWRVNKLCCKPLSNHWQHFNWTNILCLPITNHLTYFYLLRSIGPSSSRTIFPPKLLGIKFLLETPFALFFPFLMARAKYKVHRKEVYLLNNLERSTGIVAMSLVLLLYAALHMDFFIGMPRMVDEHWLWVPISHVHLFWFHRRFWSGCQGTLSTHWNNYISWCFCF